MYCPANLVDIYVSHQLTPSDSRRISSKMVKWHLRGSEHHVARNAFNIKKVNDNADIVELHRLIHDAYWCLKQTTSINTRFARQPLIPCMLARYYRFSVERKTNISLNKIKSHIAALLQEDALDIKLPGKWKYTLINALNSTTLYIVASHYGLYDLILDIHKLLYRTPLKPTPPHIIEAIAATEQFKTMSPDFFRSYLSISNAFSLVTINNEFGYHSQWVTEQIFYRLYSSLIVKEKRFAVEATGKTSASKYHRAIFGTLDTYQHIDYYDHGTRIRVLVCGYFRKHLRLHCHQVPPLVMNTTKLFCIHIMAGTGGVDVPRMLNAIDSARETNKMEEFCGGDEYQAAMKRYKTLQKYYGNLRCDEFGSYELEDEYKSDLVAVLGYLMISNAKYIAVILEAENEKTLQSKLSSFWLQKSVANCFDLNDSKLRVLSKQLLQCDVRNIECIGIEYIMRAYGHMDCGMKNIGGYGSTINVPVGGSRVHYIVAECLRFCARNGIDLDIYGLVDENEYFPKPTNQWNRMSWDECMEYVMMFHYVCSAMANSLYLRVLSLLKLTQICYQKGYYSFGLKCLKCAYDLCSLNGQVLPSFVKNGYRKWRRKFRQLSKEVQCELCGKRGSHNRKLKTCSSCMRVMYCSKECQSAHWQSSHRKDCLSSWNIVHQMLEQRLFSRLKTNDEPTIDREVKRIRLDNDLALESRSVQLDSWVKSQKTSKFKWISKGTGKLSVYRNGVLGTVYLVMEDTKHKNAIIMLQRVEEGTHHCEYIYEDDAMQKLRECVIVWDGRDYSHPQLLYTGWILKFPKDQSNLCYEFMRIVNGAINRIAERQKFPSDFKPPRLHTTVHDAHTCGQYKYSV